MSNGYVVKRSKIHGRGLFATRRFSRGELIGIYEGNATTRDGRYVLWVPQDDGSEVGIAGRGALRFVNHSVQPNGAFHGDELSALRTIEVGQEITCHYGDEWAAPPAAGRATAR